MFLKSFIRGLCLIVEPHAKKLPLRRDSGDTQSFTLICRKIKKLGPKQFFYLITFTGINKEN